jgi:GNAT superfamily N-acetyltransferase
VIAPDPNSVFLRPAAEAEVGLVVEMIRSMVGDMGVFGPDPVCEDDEPWGEVSERVEAEITAPSHLFLVAERAETPIGLVEARRERTDPVFAPKDLLHVSAVYVRPEHRRRGVATQLLRETLSWGREQGCVEAQLNTLATNPARQLYASLGFAEVRTEMRRPL